MSDDFLRHFFGGFVRLHILHHAALEPVYGVEMMEELGRHGYRLSAGTLYPILHGLEEAGYLTHEEVVVAKKRRKNYVITKKGLVALEESRVKLRELFSELIDKQPPAAEQRKKPKNKP
jgi:PadR family transcriptional regulator PadR